MTHETERVFHEAVGAVLRRAYGEDAVESKVRLGATERICDYVVTRAGRDRLCVEVENDFEAAIEGTGQAVLYANHYTLGQGIVIVPDGHIEFPENVYLWSDKTTVRELSEFARLIGLP